MWLLEVDWKTMKTDDVTPRVAHSRLLEALETAGHGGEMAMFVGPQCQGDGGTAGPATHVVYADAGKARADVAVAYVQGATRGAQTDVRRQEGAK